jgi:hypothetical protein
MEKRLFETRLVSHDLAHKELEPDSNDEARLAVNKAHVSPLDAMGECVAGVRTVGTRRRFSVFWMALRDSLMEALILYGASTYPEAYFGVRDYPVSSVRCQNAQGAGFGDLPAGDT